MKERKDAAERESTLQLLKAPQSGTVHLSPQAAPTSPRSDRGISLQSDKPIPLMLIRLGNSESTEDELNCKGDFRDAADRKSIRR